MEQEQTSQSTSINYKNTPENKCSNNTTGIIYGLIDPRYGIIRYVGKTIQTLRARLDHHIGEIKHSNNIECYRHNWFRKVMSFGVEPFPIILLTVPINQLNNWEKHYIKIMAEECHFLGHPLVNSTMGGEGDALSKEARHKISIKMRGKTTWNKGKRMSKEFMEKRWTPEKRQNVSGSNNPGYGKHKPEEQKLKISGEKNGMYGKKPWNTGLTKETDPRVNKVVQEVLIGNKFSIGRKLSRESIMKGIPKRTKITFNEVMEIRLKFTLGLTTEQLAEEYGIHRTYVKRIINKKVRTEY